MSAPTDYTMTAAQASELAGVVLVPADLRTQALRRYAATHGTDALAELAAQLIGAANSVVANCREMAEILLIDHGVHPYSAEKVNFPSLYGAMGGVMLASGTKQDGLCHGCAYRLGTVANQCASTTSDALSCAQDAQDFMCHEKLDSRGNPTKQCVGHARATKQACQEAVA